MRTIPLSQNKYALVDDEDFEYLNQWKWYYHNGYAVRKDKKTRKDILMHRVILKPPKNLFVDHRNTNKLDNRRNNLRLANHSLNMMNSKTSSKNTSGHRGITWSKVRQSWKVGIRFDGKGKHIGYFSIIDEAIMMRKIAEKVFFGEFAYDSR